MARLDRLRPFGTVHGSSGKTAYEQDGKEFDSSGNEIGKLIPGGKVDVAGPTPVLVTKDNQGNVSRNGKMLDLEGMDLTDLHKLAEAMGLELHSQLGKKKTIAAITDAAGDQLAQQLA